MSQIQKAWIFLILAILTEVASTISLKIFLDNIILSYGLMAVLIAISYYFMGLATKKISISVAYAMWEALGIVCISLIGVYFFDEMLSLYQKIGIAFGVLGIVLLNLGEEH